MAVCSTQRQGLRVQRADGARTHTHTHTQEDDRRAFERVRTEAIDEVDQWCTGEIEAVRHVMGKQLEQSQAETREW